MGYESVLVFSVLLRKITLDFTQRSAKNRKARKVRIGDLNRGLENRSNSPLFAPLFFKTKIKYLEMKKITKIFIVIVLAVASVTSVNSQDVINRIKESGELRVGTTGNQPPYSLKTKENKIIGYEMDLAALLAASMDVELKIVEMPFSELLSSLAAGKVDVIMSGMTITTERNMGAAFIGPYMVSGKSILTKTANLEKLDEQAEIDNEAVTLVALKGSTSEKFVLCLRDHENKVVFEEKRKIDQKNKSLVALKTQENLQIEAEEY